MATSNFTLGYIAAALGEALDRSQSADWQRGWHQYHDDMTRSELVRYV